ncbi:MULTISPECIES: DUF1033 family protein [unclassified Jeotgalibaca]|uniref:DUF1033 family protein n=1 Tax=unclassified Jeotgalibaca TaxID=2621505 RepID=UPI003FD66D2C
MYQVYMMKGEYEPWWFFQDWKSLVVFEASFLSFEEALKLYEEKSAELSARYPFKKSKHNYLTAFWSEEDSVYCESCEDDIQIYYGLLLLENENVIETENSKATI